MTDFRILSVCRADRTAPPSHLGTVTFDAGPFRVVGASLARMPDGTVHLYLPSAGRSRRTLFLDPALRALVRDEALRALLALVTSGTDPAAVPPLAKARDEEDDHG